jgi:hypothetical protein
MGLALSMFVVVVAAGCGAATDVPGSSGESPTLAQPIVSIEADEPDLEPPPIFLIGAGGKQRAAEGSSCVEYTNAATGESTGQCADTAGLVKPSAMTVVQPGENVMVTIPAAALKKDSAVTIRPLGCVDKETNRLDFPEAGDLNWPVDLEPGAYELDVFARFELGDGLSGDTSGTLGLLVGGGPKEYDHSGVVALDETLAVCPFQP